MDRLRRHLQDLRVAKQVPTPALYVVEHWLGFTYLLEASKTPCKLVYSLPPSCVVKVKRCASSACSTPSYCKAGNTTPCGRPAFAGPAWRVSPVTTYGGLPQDGRNLPQDGQRSPQDGRGSPTRRSAPPLSSPLLSPIPCSLFRPWGQYPRTVSTD